jgi:hypothetical protein
LKKIQRASRSKGIKEDAEESCEYVVEALKFLIIVSRRVDIAGRDMPESGCSYLLSKEIIHRFDKLPCLSPSD